MTPATPSRPNATQIPCFIKPKHKCNQAYNNLAHWQRGGLRSCVRKRILIWGYGSGIFRNSNFWRVFWVKFGLIWGETRYHSGGRKLDILWIHPPPLCSPMHKQSDANMESNSLHRSDIPTGSCTPNHVCFWHHAGLPRFIHVTELIIPI